MRREGKTTGCSLSPHSVFCLLLPASGALPSVGKRAHAVSHVEARPSPNFNKACPSVGIIQPCHLWTCQLYVSPQERLTSSPPSQIHIQGLQRAQWKQPRSDTPGLMWEVNLQWVEKWQGCAWFADWQKMKSDVAPQLKSVSFPFTQRGLVRALIEKS